MTSARPSPIAAAPASLSFITAHLIGCSLLWGSGFVFIKIVGTDLSPVALAAARGAIAAAALGLVFFAMRRAPTPRGREWRDWLVLGSLNGWIPNTLTAYALLEITAGLAAMVQAAGPVMVAVLAHFLYAEERLDARRMLGVALGFCGMIVLIGPAAFPGLDGVSLPHALAMVTTAACYSAGALYVRSIPQAEPLRLAFGQQIVSALIATVIALVILGPPGFMPIADAIVPLAALGVLATAAPIFLFMRLLRRAGPTRASMVGYLMPIVAVALAWIVLGETVGLREAAGGAIILAGVALVSVRTRRRA